MLINEFIERHFSDMEEQAAFGWREEENVTEDKV